MKRYGHIFDRLASEDNLLRAHKEARKGKLQYREVIAFDADPVSSVAAIRCRLLDGTYTVHSYRHFITYEGGKERVIDWNPCYADNVVQHAVEQTAGRYLLASCIRDTYAGFRGRGIHDGVRRIKKFLREYSADQPIYILKMDVRKFYASVDHDILKAKIRRRIKDPRVLDLLDKIIDSHPVGLPIGNYLSQLFANYFLSDFDHFVKARGFRHYARYCDDIVVIHHDKQSLHELMLDCFGFLGELKLTVKANAQVYPIERCGLNFLGYIFSRTDVRLRKSVERSFRRAVRRYKLKPCVKTFASLTSYWGWIRWCSSGIQLWFSLLKQPLANLEAKYD